MGNTEPIVTSAGIVAFVAAVIALLIAFGVNITEAQKIAILGVVGILAPLAVAWYSRPRTTSIAQPKDLDGTPLVRETPIAGTNDVTPQGVLRSMAKG